MLQRTLLELDYRMNVMNVIRATVEAQVEVHRFWCSDLFNLGIFVSDTLYNSILDISSKLQDKNYVGSFGELRLSDFKLIAPFQPH